MAEFPALPLFTDAITADCHHLTDDEYGRYVRLLILIWRSPKCRIPNDPVWISRKMSRDWTLIEPLIREFFKSDGNWITQKRLKKEFAYVTKRSKKQSDNAKSRWEKEKSKSHGIASSGNAPTPTPTPTPTEDSLFPEDEGKPHGKPTARRNKSRLAADWQPDQSIQAWAGGMLAPYGVEWQWELDKFRSHAAGNDRKQLDWTAAFQNWIRSAVDIAKRSGNRVQGGRTASDGRQGGSIVAAFGEVGAEIDQRRRSGGLGDRGLFSPGADTEG